MATNLAIDDKLLEEARVVGKHATKKAVVNEALAEYIQRRKQAEMARVAADVEDRPSGKVGRNRVGESPPFHRRIVTEEMVGRRRHSGERQVLKPRTERGDLLFNQAGNRHGCPPRTSAT